jgi:hypothetical protein
MKTLKALSYVLLIIVAIFHHAGAQVGGNRDGYVVWEKISRSNNKIRIWRANLDGSNAAQLSGEEGAVHGGPVISPDGKRVAYGVGDTDNLGEYPMNPPGGGFTTDPHPEIEIWVVNRDGSNRRKVFSGARTAGESRILRWLSATHLAVATPGGTFRVKVPESGMGVIEAGTLTGGRQTAANGLICKNADEGKKSVMVSPSGKYGYLGYGSDGRIFTIDESHTPKQLFKINWGKSCQSFVSACDRYGVGAVYQGTDKTATIDPHKEGDYNGGSWPDSKWYDYFPTIGNDATVGAMGRSSNATNHDHRKGNYDIYVFNLSLQDGLLKPTGTVVNITQSNDTDRWPDVWVSTGPATPVLYFDKSSLTDPGKSLLFYRNGKIHFCGQRFAAGAMAHVYDCRGAHVTSAAIHANRSEMALPAARGVPGKYSVVVRGNAGLMVFPIVVTQ